MATRTTCSNHPLLLLGLSLTFAGFPGCSRNEKPGDGQPAHGDHAQVESAKAAAGAHGDHDQGQAVSMLMVATEPGAVVPGEPVRLNLMIHDASGAMVRDFETVHEQKLHLIIVRDGLDQFAHIHPEVDPSGNITATFTFPTAGTYRLYADHKPAGGTQATPIAEVDVAGTPPPRPTLAPDAPGRVAVPGVTADIAIATANAAGSTRITFTLLDEAGKPMADLQSYLGAMGHLVIISADGRQFVHAHPQQEVAADGVVSFDAHFPHPGIYKGWGQFRGSDAVHDVPFVVAIE